MKFKRNLILILFLLAAIVLGALIGNWVQGSAVWWLGFGLNFGIGNPVVLNLYVLTLTFGIHFSMNICQLFLIIVALFTYKPVAKRI